MKNIESYITIKLLIILLSIIMHQNMLLEIYYFFLMMILKLYQKIGLKRLLYKQLEMISQWSKILYPSGSIQHAGVILGLGGIAGTRSTLKVFLTVIRVKSKSKLNSKYFCCNRIRLHYNLRKTSTIR